MLAPETKKLFLEIHEEYASQGATIRTESGYIEALMQLEERLLVQREDPQVIRAEFEKLLQENSAH